MAGVFEMYDNFNFVLASGDMGYDNKEKKKTFWFHKKAGEEKASWKDDNKRVCNPNSTGYALLTGEKSGCSVIDIDDPELEHNQKLIALMGDCNMIQKTRKGFHYVYKYDARLKQTTGENGQALDIRNDGGILYVEPSCYCIGKEKVEYKWDITPEMCCQEELAVIPEEVIEYLQKIGGERFVKIEKPVILDEEPAFTQETNSYQSISSEPKETDNILILLANEIDNNDSYDDWLRNGIICYNEGLGVDVWDSMSKRSKGYQAGACLRKWSSFTLRVKQLTQATWWKWLKEHKPSKYEELNQQRNDFQELIRNINHNDCAKYFYNMNLDSYLYCDALGWYAINENNVWEHSEKSIPSGFKRRISDTLQNLVREAKGAVADKYARKSKNISPADSKTQKEAESEKNESLKQLASAYKSFGNSEFINGVMSFLPSYYDDKELEEKMDMNREVFAFKDALFDLKTCVFRKINPNDFVSTTTGYEYPKQSNKKAREELNEFMFGLFENKETVAYWWNVLAYAMLGYNKFEEFYTMTGNGGNGKGVCFDLLKNVFGDYFLSVAVNLFTKPLERADQPVPALVEARAKRLVITTEPEADDKLQVSLLKKLTGGDLVEARTLHSKTIVKYKPQFSLFFQTNYIPKLSKVDGGIQRRMRVVCFPFQFVAHPTQPNERQGDPDVKNKKCLSEDWRNEFMLMLTEVWNQISSFKTLEAPPKVKEATEEYIDENNPLKSWLSKYFRITHNDSDIIKASEMKSYYLSDMNVPNMSDIRFKQLMGFNNLMSQRVTAGVVYKGIVRREDFEEQ